MRYIVGVRAPGLDVGGAGEPALPGIFIGHDGTIAFGLTIFNVDQEDLYVYELKLADPTHYRWQGGWETMRVVREPEAVKGEAPREFKLRFTRHGPVIAVDEPRRHTCPNATKRAATPLRQARINQGKNLPLFDLCGFIKDYGR